MGTPAPALAALSSIIKRRSPSPTAPSPGNTAQTAGGGIYSYNYNPGTLTLKNSIIGGNTAGLVANDIYGTITDNGYNLITDTTDTAVVGGQFAVTDVTGLAPELSGLGYYGGPTETMAVLPDSPAFDAGSPSGPDQRGLPAGTDIGAFQTQVFPLLVNTADDTATGAEPYGDLSLRDAITLGNVLAPTGGASTITFDPSLSGDTITLAGVALPDITADLTINGLGANQLTVSADGDSGVFTIDNGATVTISGLTIEDGNVSTGNALDVGGGITNSGTLTLTASTVTGNTALQGGGIVSGGTLYLQDCTVTGNTAVYSNGPGSAGGTGGGIYSYGVATVIDSTVANNTAAWAGGIYNDNSTLTLTDSTVAGNTATNNSGGGIVNEATLSLTDCTITGNTATTAGGGIYTGGGTSLTLGNSILSGNYVSSSDSDLAGTPTSVTDNGFNLIGATTIPLSAQGDLVGLPDLSPLGYYGGPTETMTPLPGSPVIGAGDPSQAGTISQNGVVRPATPDIGAFQTTASGNPLVVTTTADSGTGSLRAAITYADDNGGGTITFDIVGDAPFTIEPQSALPSIGDGITIDGTSQPGYSGTPIIVLDGDMAGSGVNGLTLTGSGSTIQGLVINQFTGDGIDITGSGATGNVVDGNYIGTNAAGTGALGNGARGVDIESAPGTVVSGNTIGANGDAGVYVGSADNTLIENNDIGTDAAGDIGLGNGGRGIYVQGTSLFTVTGTVITGNLVSANGTNTPDASGIRLEDDSGTVVQGNMIGTDPIGTTALGNGLYGLRLVGSMDDLIGGTQASQGNVISGNASDGIYFDTGSTGNVVEGNDIGVDASGTLALGNGGYGVYLTGAYGNQVTDGNVISANGQGGVYMTGNTALSGLVSLYQADGNANDSVGGNNGTVEGNLTYGAGNQSQAFTFDGTDYVQIPDASSLNPTQITITGWIKPDFMNRPFDGSNGTPDTDTIFAKRLDIRSAGYGLFLVEDAGFGLPLGTPVFDLVVNGTFHEFYGSTPVPNDGFYHNVTATYDGTTAQIFLDGTQIASLAVSGSLTPSTGVPAFIGTTGDGRNSKASIDNVAVFNRALSTPELLAFIAAGSPVGNTVAGNYIGTNAAGTQNLGNHGAGLELDSEAVGNTIGGTTAGTINVISGNSGYGIELSSAAGAGNAILGNEVGVAAGGTTVLANGGLDVSVASGSGAVFLGGTLTIGSGGLDINAPTTLSADTTITSIADGNVTFDGTIDGAQSLTVNTGGVTTFNDDLGDTTPLANLTTDAPGTTYVNAALNVTGSITLPDLVTPPNTSQTVNVTGNFNDSGSDATVTIMLSATSTVSNPVIVASSGTTTVMVPSDLTSSPTIYGGPVGATTMFVLPLGTVAPTASAPQITLVDQGGTNILDLSGASLSLPVTNGKTGATINVGVTLDLTQNTGGKQLLFQPQLHDPDIGTFIDPSLLTSTSESSLSLMGNFQTVMVGSGSRIIAAPSGYNAVTGAPVLGTNVVLMGTDNTVYGAPGATITAASNNNTVIQNFNETQTTAYVGSILTADPASLGNLLTSNPSGFGNLLATNPSAFGNLLASNPSAFGSLLGSNPSGFGSILATNPSALGSILTSNASAFGSLLTTNPSAFGSILTTDPSGFASLLQSNASGFGSLLATNPTAFGSVLLSNGMVINLSMDAAANASLLTSYPSAVASLLANNPSAFGSLLGSISTSSGSLLSTSAAGFGSLLGSNPSAFGSLLASSPSAFGSLLATDPSAFGSLLAANPSGFGSLLAASPSAFGSLLALNPTAFGSLLTSNASAFGSLLATSPSSLGSLLSANPTGLGSLLAASSSGLGSILASSASGLGSLLAASPTGLGSLLASNPSGLGSLLSADPTGLGSLLSSNASALGSLLTSTPSGLASLLSFNPSGFASLFATDPSAFGSLLAAGISATASQNASLLANNPTGFANLLAMYPSALGSLLTSQSTAFASLLTNNPTGFGNILASNPSAFASFLASGASAFGSLLASNPTGFATLLTTSPSALGSLLSTNPSAFGSLLASDPSGFGSILAANPSGLGSLLSSNPSGLGSLFSTNPSGLGSLLSTSASGLGSFLASTPSAFGSLLASSSSAFGSLLAVNPSGLGSLLASNASAFGSLLASNPTAAASLLANSPSAFGSLLSLNASALGSLLATNASAFGSFLATNASAFGSLLATSPSAFGNLLAANPSGFGALLASNSSALGALLAANPSALGTLLAANPTGLGSLLAANPSALGSLLGSNASGLGSLLGSNASGLGTLLSSDLGSLLTTNPSALTALLSSNSSALGTLLASNPTGMGGLLASDPSLVNAIFADPANSTYLTTFLNDNPSVVTTFALDLTRLNVNLAGTSGNQVTGGLLANYNIGTGSIFTENITSGQLDLLSQGLGQGVAASTYDLNVTADGGNNTLVGGFMGNFTANGGGNNNFIIEDPSFLGIAPGTSLSTDVAGSGCTFTGSGGNDTFYFVGGSSGNSFGNVMLAETASTGTDTLDFSNYLGGGVNLNLNDMGVSQVVTPNMLTLTLPSSPGITNVVGSPASDTIVGNGQNNQQIQGSAVDSSDPYALAAVPPPIPQTQYVYLDFTDDPTPPDTEPAVTFDAATDVSGNIITASQNSLVGSAVTGLETGQTVIYDIGSSSNTPINPLVNGGTYGIIAATATEVELTATATFQADTDVSGATITTSANTGLETGEAVTYDAQGNTPIGGLVNGDTYYVIVGSNTVQLASTLANAEASMPVPITLTSAGSGTQILIGSTPITLTSMGSGTQSLDVPVVENLHVHSTVPAVTFQAGTAVNGSTITAPAPTDLHTGQAVIYDNQEGTSIGGLVNGTTYYVIAVPGSTTQVQLASSPGGPAIALTPGSGTQSLDVTTSVTDPAPGSYTAVEQNAVLQGLERDYASFGNLVQFGLTPPVQVASSNANTYTVTFETVGTPPTVSADPTLLAGNSPTLGVTGTSSGATLTFGGDITGGTFTLTDNGVTTAPIAWSCTPATLAANIQAALNAVTPYETVYFNKTLVFDGTPTPGGYSDEIDFRNLNLETSMQVDINGVLGNQVPDTEADFLNLTVNVTAHEIGHTLGLQHMDAFSPIEFGISNPPGAGVYYPAFPGQVGAFATQSDIMSSPAAVGTTIAQVASTQESFDERDAVNLAFINGGTVVQGTYTGSDEPNVPGAALPYTVSAITSAATSVAINNPSINLVTETAPTPTSPTPGTTTPVGTGPTIENAEPVSLYTLSVPNPITSGFDAGKTFDVAAVDVLGTLTGSHPDFYTFQGQKNDLMNFETWSKVLTRITNPVDTVLYVYGPNGNLLGWDDDQFESSDSSILDLTLPCTGTYTVEVDSYGDATKATPTPAGTSGDYELFMYRFDAFNGTSGNDQIYSAAPAITSGPATPIASASATFTFNANNSTSLNTVDIEFLLDGSPVTPTTVNYSMGTVTLTGIALAQTHTFAVADLDSSGNVLAESNLWTWTAQATPTVTVTDANGTYDGDPFAATALVADAATLGGTGLTLDYVRNNADGTTTDLGSQAPRDAGSYTATASFAGSPDYTSASVSTTFTISPKALTYSGLSVPASKVYDGTTTAVVSGTAALMTAETAGTGSTSDGTPYSGDSVSLTGTPTGTYNSKDVATATMVTFGGLSLTGAQSGDYTLTVSTQAATITAKALTYSGLTVPASKVYNGTTTAVVSGTAALQVTEAAGAGTTADGKPYRVDSVSLTGTPTGTYNSKDVATAAMVTFGGLSLTGRKAATTR